MKDIEILDKYLNVIREMPSNDVDCKVMVHEYCLIIKAGNETDGFIVCECDYDEFLEELAYGNYQLIGKN